MDLNHWSFSSSKNTLWISNLENKSSLSFPADKRLSMLFPMGLKKPLAIAKLEKTFHYPCFILISELPNIKK